MTYLKIMNDSDLLDHDPSKGFVVVAVDADEDVKFYRLDDGSPVIRVNSYKTDSESRFYHPSGNTYILNDHGKTIGKFSFSI